MDRQEVRDWEHSQHSDDWLKSRLTLCCKPVGTDGIELAHEMNLGHGALVSWGLDTYLGSGSERLRFLDIGCGGGATLRALRERYPEGVFSGIDYSADMVALARDELGDGVEISHGSVAELPYAATAFDMITAVETVYFWPDIVGSFAEVYRVLAPEGRFQIINEMYDDPQHAEYTARNQRMVRLSALQLFAPETLEKALLEAGFKQVEYVTLPENNWITYSASKG